MECNGNGDTVDDDRSDGCVCTCDSAWTTMPDCSMHDNCAADLTKVGIDMDTSDSEISDAGELTLNIDIPLHVEVTSISFVDTAVDTYNYATPYSGSEWTITESTDQTTDCTTDYVFVGNMFDLNLAHEVTSNEIKMNVNIVGTQLMQVTDSQGNESMQSIALDTVKPISVSLETDVSVSDSTVLVTLPEEVSLVFVEQYIVDSNGEVTIVVAVESNWPYKLDDSVSVEGTAISTGSTENVNASLGDMTSTVNRDDSSCSGLEDNCEAENTLVFTPASCSSEETVNLQYTLTISDVEEPVTFAMELVLDHCDAEVSGELPTTSTLTIGEQDGTVKSDFLYGETMYLTIGVSSEFATITSFTVVDGTLVRGSASMSLSPTNGGGDMDLVEISSSAAGGEYFLELINEGLIESGNTDPWTITINLEVEYLDEVKNTRRRRLIQTRLQSDQIEFNNIVQHSVQKQVFINTHKKRPLVRKSFKNRLLK